MDEIWQISIVSVSHGSDWHEIWLNINLLLDFNGFFDYLITILCRVSIYLTKRSWNKNILSLPWDVLAWKLSISWNFVHHGFAAPIYIKLPMCTFEKSISQAPLLILGNFNLETTLQDFLSHKWLLTSFQLLCKVQSVEQTN